MSEGSFDIHGIAESVAQQCAATIRADLSGIIDRMQTEYQRMTDHAANISDDIHRRLTDNLALHIAAIDACAEASSNRVLDAANTITVQVNDASVKALRDIADTAAQAYAKLERVEETARAAVAEAGEVKVRAEAMMADANRRVAEAEETESNAQRAVQIMTLRAEREIAQQIAQMELKAEEKALRDELERKRAALENRADMENSELERGINRFYPDMAKRLDELVAEAEKETQER